MASKKVKFVLNDGSVISVSDKEAGIMEALCKGQIEGGRIAREASMASGKPEPEPEVEEEVYEDVTDPEKVAALDEETEEEV